VCRAEGGLEFSAVPVKSEFVVCEPVLIRLEFRAPADSGLYIAHPFVDVSDIHARPLAFEVWSWAGQRLPNGLERPASPFEPVAFGEPWWLDGGMHLPGRAFPHVPWYIPAGAVARMWLDLTEFYPIDAPGDYNVRFEYRPAGNMASWVMGKTAPWDHLWVGTLHADAGRITIVEPPEADTAARDELLRLRGANAGVISNSQEVRQTILDQYPTSVYATCASFFEWCERVILLPRPFFRYPREELDGLGLFVAERPDWPLNYRVPTMQALVEWHRAHSAFGMYPSGPVVDGTKIADYQRATKELRRTAQESGDYELMTRIEWRVWYATTSLERDGVRTGVEPVICPGSVLE
jgi:hypothetical protein